jgi:hypothetical protein
MPQAQARLIACLLERVKKLQQDQQQLVGGANRNSVKSVVFDADGTLLDSLPPHIDFCHEMNKQFGTKLELPSTTDLAGCRSLSAVSTRTSSRTCVYYSC